VGAFLEIAQGNTFLGAGGNRYSFTYSGDVNGDGFGGNDLIHIPTNATDPSEIRFDPSANRTAAQQAVAFEAFIEQDDYLSGHRGQIAERFGAINPWFWNVDLRVMQEIGFTVAGRPQRVQVSLDLLNAANLLSSDLGVRRIANPLATSPLVLTRFDTDGEPVFNFTGVDETYVDDFSLLSRWQLQLGVKYLFN
jgi:hypothetical protein